MKQRKITEHLLKEFETYLLESEKSRATIEKYMRDVRCFQRFVGNVKLEKGIV